MRSVALQLQFALVGAVYTGGACLASGIRGKEDTLNYGVGGALVGALYGLRMNRISSAVYGGVLLGGAGIFCAVSEHFVTRAWTSESGEKEQQRNVYLQKK